MDITLQVMTKKEGMNRTVVALLEVTKFAVCLKGDAEYDLLMEEASQWPEADKIGCFITFNTSKYGAVIDKDTLEIKLGSHVIIKDKYGNVLYDGDYYS